MNPDWTPTRLSAKVGEPGNLELNSLKAREERALVFLDGVEVRNCVAADTKEGWVERAKLDAEGQFMIEGDEIIHELIRGKVSFKIESNQ